MGAHDYNFRAQEEPVLTAHEQEVLEEVEEEAETR